MFHLHPCKLFSWFSQWLVCVLPVAFLNSKWCHGEGDLLFPGKGTNQKRSKPCLRRGSLGEQAGGLARAVWAHRSYSLPQVWGGLFPWMLSCQCAAREERRGRVSEVTGILMWGWLRSVLSKRMWFIGTVLADASTSSKQSVQKTGRGLHVLAT